MGHPAHNIAVANSMIERDPRSAGAYRLRGYSNYCLGDLELAVADLAESIRLGGPGRPLSQKAFLRILLMRLEQGAEPGTVRGMAREFRDKVQPENWIRVIFDFLCADLTESEFLQKARNLVDGKDRFRCESLFYAAHMRRAAGDVQEARLLFERCLATGDHALNLHVRLGCFTP